jgi:L-lactate permease
MNMSDDNAVNANVLYSEYICQSGANASCPVSCVGLEECQDCSCAVIDQNGGAWGDAMDVIMCLLPILFLLVATLKPSPLPTTQSLPGAALLLFLIRLMYLASDPLLVCASVVAGLHEALSPLSIMFGAIFLFETMEATLCMPFMMREMKALTKGHPVAELMLLFCFAYMVEGASGFGTPVALGAPMLVSLGYPKLESVVTLLLMNTFATLWGAAGRSAFCPSRGIPLLYAYT